MKLRRSIITGLVIIILAILVIIRLISNKKSFDTELKMVTELNTTIPVMTDTVKYVQLEKGFIINGTYSPFREVSVSAEIPGRIVSVKAETGDIVKTGQILAVIDNELASSQLELAKFNLEKAKKDLDRFEELSKADAATAAQYETINQVYVNARFAYTSAKSQYDNSFIKAPFNGSVTKRLIETGTYAGPGSPVFNIVETDRMKFSAKLTVDEAEKVKKGDKVYLTAEPFPGVEYYGEVSNITVKEDLSKRYDIEIEVMNRADKFIKPGMYGNGAFNRDTKENALVIPRKAIAGSILNPEIFVVNGNEVIKREITAVSMDEKYIIVRSGLKKGDIIVTAGQINLVNGSRIRINN
jgi:membrane fusion protein, multidrug efflux system